MRNDNGPEFFYFSDVAKTGRNRNNVTDLMVLEGNCSTDVKHGTILFFFGTFLSLLYYGINATYLIQFQIILFLFQF